MPEPTPTPTPSEPDNNQPGGTGEADGSQNGNDNPSGSENGGTGDAESGKQENAKQEDNNGAASENQQESVQTADKTHSVWYLFGAAVSAMLAGFAGSKRKKKSDEEL